MISWGRNRNCTELRRRKTQWVRGKLPLEYRRKRVGWRLWWLKRNGAGLEWHEGHLCTKTDFSFALFATHPRLQINENDIRASHNELSPPCYYSLQWLPEIRRMPLHPHPRGGEAEYAVNSVRTERQAQNIFSKIPDSIRNQEWPSPSGRCVVPLSNNSRHFQEVSGNRPLLLCERLVVARSRKLPKI